VQPRLLRPDPEHHARPEDPGVGQIIFEDFFPPTARNLALGIIFLFRN
jgi:hypothetical protein